MGKIYKIKQIILIGNVFNKFEEINIEFKNKRQAKKYISKQSNPDEYIIYKEGNNE